MNKSCPGCQANKLENLFTVANVPVSCGQLFPSAEAAVKAELCKLEITICPACGHIWNAAHQGTTDALYNDDYYSSFSASAQGREYQKDLAENLDQVVGLSGRTVLELGCGDGHFLKLLSSLGANAIGFEPSSTFQLAKNQSGIEVHQEHFDFQGRQELDPKVDVVVMRHVLEHLDSPLQALKSLRVNTSRQTSPRFLFLEVPNVYQLLMDNLYFDFYNDHVQYFSHGSLGCLTKLAGWRPMAWIEGREEFLRLVCVDENSPEDTVNLPGSNLTNSVETPEAGEDIAASAADFGSNFLRWTDALAHIINDFRDGGGRVAVWGAGARGVALLSGLGLSPDNYSYIVDSDANKHARYFPSMQVPIFPPEHLREDPVDCVLVTSYTYFNEIFSQLEWFRAAGGRVIRAYPVPKIVN